MNPGMIVKEFRIRDYAEVVKLWMTSGLDIRPGDSREGIKTKLTRDNDLFLVAWIGGSIVGVAMGTWDGRRGWIHRLAVDDKYRRRGIAKRLVGIIQERLVSKGATKVDTLVHRGNSGSLRFFEALGYERDPEYVLMGKLLIENWRPSVRNEKRRTK